MRRAFKLSDCGGYVLLPVVMAIALTGAIVFVMSRTTGVNIKTVATRTEMARARYVAEAGLSYGKWFISSTCGEATATGTPFQGHTFDVTIANTSGNNYHITAIGNLSTGESSSIETNTTCTPPPATTKLYWSEDNTDKIWMTYLDGSSPVEVNTNSGWPTPITVDPTNKLIYWVDGSYIRRSSLDGSGATNLISLGSHDVRGIAVDPGNKIYWTVMSYGIRRANVDGSGIETLITCSVGYEPHGIDLDLNAGKIYWTDRYADAICRMNLDGTGFEYFIQWLGRPCVIAVDSDGGKVYWNEEDNERLLRANLDGSGTETLVTFSGTDTVRGIALDTENGKLYWADWSRNNIYWANLDGSSDAVLKSQTSPWDIAVGPSP